MEFVRSVPWCGLLSGLSDRFGKGCGRGSFKPAGQTPVHDGDGLGVGVDEEEAAAVLRGGFAGGSAAGEEVEDEVSGVGVDADDAFEDAEGLLGGVAGLLLSCGADDGVPPDVSGGFAAGGLFGADERGGHVGDAVDLVEVEGVEVGVAGVPEDVVVLGGPAFFCAGAVVVGPDDLVLEAGATEDRRRA